MTAETLAELGQAAGDATLRMQLTDFTALYKFTIDTLVKRKCSDDCARQKFNHSYLQLTPEVTRGMEVTLFTAGNKKVLHKSRTLQNAHSMAVSATLV